MRFVLDASLTMSWCFQDEQDSYADQILEIFQKSNNTAIVPTLWCYEIVNILRSAHLRKRINYTDQLQFLSFLDQLSIEIIDINLDMNQLLSISEKFNLSAYDSVYLYLAISYKLPLATVDKELKKAAEKAEVYAGNKWLIKIIG